MPVARPGLPFGYEELTAADEGGGLGHRGGAEGGERGAGGVRNGDPGQHLGRVRPQRQPEPGGGAHDPRFTGLRLDGDQLGDRAHRKPRLPQHLQNQPGHLVGTDAPGGADPDDERAEMRGPGCIG